MKILVLGGDGMLGHQLIDSLSPHHDLACTVRGDASDYTSVLTGGRCRLFGRVDARDFASIRRAAHEFRPDAIVNAIGIVKQRSAAHDAIESIEINSLLPHRLSGLCIESGVRLVHLSTDCVFDGAKGNYADDALHDARDIYGRTKSLGEVAGVGVITLRTSIIGLELSRKASLVEWFLSQSGQVRGFTKAIFSGFTTKEMARIIDLVLSRSDSISGIYNVSSSPIDKYSLLRRLRALLNFGPDVLPDEEFECDRSLDSARFRSVFGYTPPTWDSMISELAEQVMKRSSVRDEKA